MKKGLAALLLALSLSGCISLGSAPPGKTYVVVPQGSSNGTAPAQACGTGSAPPCQ